ncbi:hypothetical protein T03_11704 [Trichinella britovi]|uniref:Uncharacterized protein n=1 Tax=Trichinella britovi TaxID=45882 RepID=A0A0V1C8H6_TRIBR|nr:hypothetical protein T03_11704 [Trichinella britovi]
MLYSILENCSLYFRSLLIGLYTHFRDVKFLYRQNGLGAKQKSNLLLSKRTITWNVRADHAGQLLNENGKQNIRKKAHENYEIKVWPCKKKQMRAQAKKEEESKIKILKLRSIKKNVAFSSFFHSFQNVGPMRRRYEMPWAEENRD